MKTGVIENNCDTIGTVCHPGGHKVTITLEYCSLLPIFIVEENVKFSLEVGANGDVVFPYPNSPAFRLPGPNTPHSESLP